MNDLKFLPTGLECKKNKPPKNGLAPCNELYPGTFKCSVMCKEGYDFGYKPARLYFCSKGDWGAWSDEGVATFPWPDCSRKCSVYASGTKNRT